MRISRPFLAVLICASLPSCSLLRPKDSASAPGDVPSPAVVDSTAPSVPPPLVEPDTETFHYCPVETVRQSSEKNGGLATLTSVMRYWDTEALESELAAKYPPEEPGGYTMMQLRRIAVDEGLMAFSITMKLKPMVQLGEQLEHGRPVLVSLRFSDGAYFGNDSAIVEALAKEQGGMPVPVIETNRNYFFIVFGQSESQVLLMDPQFGVVSVDKPVFTRYWKEGKYAALLCSAE